jgi:glutamate---cysteine ligase / carboxylate-amine ligase
LKSFRTKVFDRFPRTSIPEYFDSPAEFDDFVRILVQTGCIDNGKKIWWDVRAHYLYDTVEVRICDMPTNIEDTVALVALVQALMAKLYFMYKRNTAWRSYHRSLIEENKWRAQRYGTDAKMIDFGMSAERPFPELVDELLEFVSETAELFGTGETIQRIRTMAREGTSAHRQIEVFQRAQDSRAVVDWLIDETMRGV